ncbi:ABC transporter permease [Roseovarius sp.]|uniref:ABC transporter permease n=1 Tax=Roseovarius sp. TaxID=1486281 RepID=UPI000C5AB98E|nr:ABC transporter permease [Roseovarius sp.]MAZ21029.1 ABC transporter permease [Roseovarius sp.]
MPRLGPLILKRLGMGVLTLIAVSMIIFGAIEMLPGDIAQEILGQSATPESVAAFRRELGLDEPAVIRYFDWAGGILTGDFGTSLASGREVSELIWSRLGNTIFLAVYAAMISVPLAVTLGLLAALFRNSVFDRIANLGALSSVSMPEFFLAYILIYFFSLSGLFPSMADVTSDTPLMTRLYTVFLPALTLTLVITAHMMRMTRAAIINLLASPYIEMAELKGISRKRVILRHALPNALAPIINVIALNLAYLVTGVVIVEVVFVYPGLGQLMVDSVSKRDVVVVQSVSLIFASAFILLNLLADVLSTLSNPRLVHTR